MATATNKDSIKDIIDVYELKQRLIISNTLRQIMELFDQYATQSSFLYAKRRLIGNRFLPKDIRATIERISNTVNARTREIIINGIRRSFLNSELKNNIIETKAAGGRRIPPSMRTRLAQGSFGRQRGIITAVDAFVKRKQAGLNLSQRVFKLSSSYKKSISQTMVEGLKKGTSARELAKQQRKNLRNNTVIENPGQGVYKSPQKNAERLTISEINMAYANADFERWQVMDSVIAIEVRLSNTHPKYDICDLMIGRYPKDFHFTKWHPRCKCIAIPILAPQEIRDAIMDFKLGIIDKPPVIPYLKNLPSSAIGWMKNNAERVNGWKHTPIWIKANTGFVGKYFN